jgi:hypothetical protein
MHAHLVSILITAQHFNLLCIGLTGLVKLNVNNNIYMAAIFLHIEKSVDASLHLDFYINYLIYYY